MIIKISKFLPRVSSSDSDHANLHPILSWPYSISNDPIGLKRPRITRKAARNSQTSAPQGLTRAVAVEFSPMTISSPLLARVALLL